MRGHRWVGYSVDEMDAVQAALQADKDACPECGNTPVPHAAHTYVANGRAVSYQCRSGCRFYNPVTGQMEGRKHCTCDSCW